MEPIPETREAIDEFGPFADDGDLLEHLSHSATQVQSLVPSCVGITLALVHEGLAFTLVATAAELAALDAVQYLDDGPCVRSTEQGQRITFHGGDPTDEQQWQRFARATAYHGVASTLTIPILSDVRTDPTGAVPEVVGSVNLYASTSRAFEGHHDQVADLFGAWAAGSIANADLDFDTRRAARQAPRLLRDQMVVSQAIGRLIILEGIDAGAARDMLASSALRAGVDIATVAAHVLQAWEGGSA